MISQGAFDIVSYWFFQKALLLSLLAAIPCAIIGTYIVIKRISMITGSISHSTFGGLGISYYLGFAPFVGGAIFGVVAGASIGFLQRKAKKRLDTILSFLWAFGMSIGLIFVYLTPGYNSDLFSYLFGNIFLISNTEMQNLLIINVVVIVAVVLTFHTITAVLFDEEFAEVRNLPIMVSYLIFYVLIGLTVIIILSIVGVVLLIAFLTLPPAIALFYQKTIKKTMLWSGIIVAFTNILGLFVAHWIALPPGPIIILILSLFYLMSLGWDTYKNRRKGKKRKITPHACQSEIKSFGIFQKYIQEEEEHHKQGEMKKPLEGANL